MNWSDLWNPGWFAVWAAWAVGTIVSVPLLTAWVIRGERVDLERGGVHVDED